MAPILKMLGYGTVIMGTGVLLYKYTTPSNEEFYQSLSPELKAKADEIHRRQKNNASNAEVDRIKAGADAEQPVWRKPTKS